MVKTVLVFPGQRIRSVGMGRGPEFMRVEAPRALHRAVEAATAVPPEEEH